MAAPLGQLLTSQLTLAGGQVPFEFKAQLTLRK